MNTSNTLIRVGAGGFLLFLLTGGLFVGLTSLVPEAYVGWVACGLGVVFTVAYFYLLVSRMMSLFSEGGNVWLELSLAIGNVLLLMTAYAAVYTQFGIVNLRGSENEVTKDFWQCAYYSVVTFTSLGYGDYVPQGLGKVMACLEALTGYLVLGIVASSSASLLKQKATA